MRDRQLHKDHHSNDRDASRRYVQMTDEVHLEETDASGSRDCPCRAVFLRPLPKLPPQVGALSSNELCRQSLLEDRQRDMTKWVSGFSLPLTPVCTVIGMLCI